MNRLTKKISLVLISSSLILHGCHRSPVDEEKKREDEKTGGAWTTGPGGHYVHTGPHFYHFGSQGASRVGSSSCFRSGGGSSSGTRSGIGGSARGGFGGSAHGVGS